MKKYRKMSSFNHNLKNILSHAQFKPIIITIGAALCIGFIFGFVVLQMVQEEKGQATTDNRASTVKTLGDEKQIELPALSLYVQQGGVFSKAENATDYAKALQKREIPFIMREEDGQHYVWMNPANNENNAKRSVEKMDKQGINVYIKKWEVPATTLDLNSGEMEWIQTYQQLLATSLEKSTIDVKQWQSLLEKELHAEYDEWQSKLQEILDKEADSEEQLLLHMIAHYEKIIKDAKQ